MNGHQMCRSKWKTYIANNSRNLFHLEKLDDFETNLKTVSNFVSIFIQILLRIRAIHV